MRTTAPATTVDRDTPAVLIVDDYQDARDLYSMYLDFAGFRAIKARDGFEALRIAEQTMPDVILMDLGLPGLDGHEVTRRLKNNPLTARIPVIALTAQSVSAHDDVWLKAEGFERLVIKPCLPDDLVEVVDSVVREHGMPDDNREPVDLHERAAR